MSSGFRLVTTLPSTTTSSSTQSPPAFRMSVSSVGHEVTRLPRTTPDSTSTHGPWVLVESGVVRGKRLTSWPTLETDIRNAGGEWTDEEVVVDGNLVTSRKPDDIPAFNREMLRIFSGERVPA